MQSQKTLSFFIPSLAEVLFAVILLSVCFVHGERLLSDGDTGFHIRAGEIILQTGKVPVTDPFSLHTPALKWTAHEWLSEVLMAKIHHYFGLTGLVIAFAFIVACIYPLFFISLRSRCNILIALILTLLTLRSTVIHWLVRPHIFTLFFTMLFYLFLERFQKGEKKILYALPPLMLLWVNLHGGFIVGFVLLGIYILGNLIEPLLNGSHQENTAAKIRPLLFILLACLLASFINPQGPWILTFPFKTITNKYLLENVDEFLSPNFHKFGILRVLLVLIVTVLAASGWRLNGIEILLIAFFTNMGLFSIRHMTLLAIVAPLIIAPRLEKILSGLPPLNGLKRKFSQLTERVHTIDQQCRGHLWLVLAPIIVGMAFASGKISYDFPEKQMPVRAFEFIKEQKIEGPLFANDEFGDYIIYKGWPDYKVFIDGRSDMYPPQIIEDYFSITRLKPDWKEVFEKYRFNVVIDSSEAPFVTLLKEIPGWSQVYSDKTATVFVKKN